MSLREQAEADQEFILENLNDFGVPIKLTDLEYNEYNVVGKYNRIGVDIDPETGLLVIGNKSTVTIRLSSLDGAIPAEGWLIEMTDILGTLVKGKATYVMLDRTFGRATMLMKK